MARTKGGVFYPAIFGSLRENNGSTDSSRPRHDLASLNSLLGVTQREQYFTGSYGGMGSGSADEGGCILPSHFRVSAGK